MSNMKLYVLRLENEKIYVGITSDFIRRMIEHVYKKGAKSTKESTPIALMHLYDLSNYDFSDSAKIENFFTYYFCEKYGYQNVSGGMPIYYPDHNYKINRVENFEYYNNQFKDVLIKLGLEKLGVYCHKKQYNFEKNFSYNFYVNSKNQNFSFPYFNYYALVEKAITFFFNNNLKRNFQEIEVYHYPDYDKKRKLTTFINTKNKKHVHN